MFYWIYDLPTWTVAFLFAFVFIAFSWFTGEGLIQFQTKVAGFGKVVVRANGPVEEIEVKNSRFLAEGKYVVGRTGDIAYTVRRPTRSYFSYLLSGESYLRCFEGSGRLLVAATPYWRMRIQDLTMPS